MGRVVWVLALLVLGGCRPKLEPFSQKPWPGYEPPHPRSSISFGWIVEPEPEPEPEPIPEDFGDRSEMESRSIGASYGLGLPTRALPRRYCEYDGEPDARIRKGLIRSGLTQCYGDEEPYAGKVRLAFEVTEDGRAENVELVSSTLPVELERVQRCMVHRVHAQRFEPADRRTRASCPFTVGVDPPPESYEKR